MDFMDLEKVYDRVNKEPIWQVLRIYDRVVKFSMELRVCMLVVN